MTIDICLKNVFPEIDSLGGIKQPGTGQAYRPLTVEKLTRLAERVTDRVKKTGIQTVIVCESGAVPFAKMCALIAKKRNLGIKWYSIKIPRNVTETFQAVLHACLNFSIEQLSLSLEAQNKENTVSFTCHMPYKTLPVDFFSTERLSLKNILSLIVNEPDLSEREYFLSLTKVSALAAILKQPFILFDEYIDSGHTLHQTLRFFSLFSRNLKFRIFSYLAKMDRSDMDPLQLDSLYFRNESEAAYAEGVYPFENRLDYLGYFYWITPNEFSRISLETLTSTHHPASREDILKWTALHEHHTKGPLLGKARQLSRIPEISKWITHSQLAQFLLYRIEKSLIGNSEISEFWHQVFDMYGPMWSPFPDAWHLDYLSAFSDLEPDINAIFIHEPALVEGYRHLRNQLVHCVASHLLNQHTRHHTNVTQSIGAIQ